MCISSIVPRCIKVFLHDLYRPGDAYACYRVLLLLTFIGGIVPCEFRSRPSRHLKTTLFGYMNSLSRIGFYVFIFGYSMTHEQSLLAHFFESQVSRLTDSLQHFNGMFGILMVLYLCLVQSAALIELMARYELVELRLSRLGVRFLQRNCSLRINCTIVGMFCANIGFILYGSLMVFARNGVSVSVIASISFYSPHLIVSGVVVLFSSIMQKMTPYFVAVNKVNVKFLIMKLVKYSPEKSRHLLEKDHFD